MLSSKTSGWLPCAWGRKKEIERREREENERRGELAHAGEWHHAVNGVHTCQLPSRSTKVPSLLRGPTSDEAVFEFRLHHPVVATRWRVFVIAIQIEVNGVISARCYLCGRTHRTQQLQVRSKMAKDERENEINNWESCLHLCRICINTVRWLALLFFAVLLQVALRAWEFMHIGMLGRPHWVVFRLTVNPFV